MKLIKKIAAIMFAFMMVVSMSCNVKAEDTEGVYGQKDGSITITGALQGQTYTIYEMLKLESFSGTNYSYKIADGWENFFREGAEGAAYMKKDENGYMSFIAGKDGAPDRREFAQKALVYAKKTTGINTKSESTKENETTVTFNGLNLGYYLVGSTTGTLCGLDTTNKHVDIEEKNGVPSVEKKIVQNNTDVESNFANIGETINFKTTITAQKGAQSYVLHDTMDKGLTFNNNVKVKISGKTEDLIQDQDYKLITNPTDKTCAFEIKFMDTFLNAINGETKIEVTYSATLNADAEIHIGNNNTTYLTYGNNNKSNTSETHTVTYEIKVLKYTKNLTTPLPNAKFSLYDAETNGNTYKLVQKTGTTNYRLAMTDEAGITEITTTNTGMFSIQGLKPGTYWLEETAAPKGYNKLAKRIKVEINNGGNLIVDNNDRGENNLPINQVNVENKTGTVLPSTGGAGTTMIYLIGGALVLGSGVVLVTKRRVKGK